MWGLGNIAGDSVEFRDMVLDLNVLEDFLAVHTREGEKLSARRNATWALSNLIRGKPQPPLQRVSPALPTVSQLVREEDEEILADACWCASYMSDGNDHWIQSVLDAGIHIVMVTLLQHANDKVVTPALRTVGNIVSGNDEQTQALLDAGVLANLAELLYHEKISIRKEACWSISNVLAGSRSQIQQLLDMGIVEVLIKIVGNEVDEVVREIAWSLGNFCHGGSDEQKAYLVNIGGLEPLLQLVSHDNTRVLDLALGAIKSLLEVPREVVLVKEHLLSLPTHVELLGLIDTGHPSAEVTNHLAEIDVLLHDEEEEVEGESFASLTKSQPSAPEMPQPQAELPEADPEPTATPDAELLPVPMTTPTDKEQMQAEFAPASTPEAEPLEPAAVPAAMATPLGTEQVQAGASSHELAQGEQLQGVAA